MADPPAAPATGWDPVVALAEAERLAPALAFGVARVPGPALPPAVAARLGTRFKEALARHVG